MSSELFRKTGIGFEVLGTIMSSGVFCGGMMSGVKAESCTQQVLSRELPAAMGKDAESVGKGKWARGMERLRWHPTCSS